MPKDFLVSLSLANLFYIGVWSHTLYNYSEWGLSGAVSLIALVLNVLLLTLIIWCTIRFVRNSSSSTVRVVGRAGFFIVMILALNGVRPFLPDLSVDKLQERLGKTGLQLERFEPFELIVVGMIVGVLFSYAWLQARRYMINTAATILVMLSPLAPILLGDGVWLWYKGALATSRPLSEPLPAKEGKPRIVWVVFDELDYRLTFVERPVSLQLPEFDRFRSQSIDATRSLPPGDNTQESMPSLITGRLVSSSEPIQLDEWLLTLERGEKAGWSTLPNVFSLARTAGFNSGLVGWFLPYCRIIGNDMTACFSPLQRDRHRQMTLPEVMIDQTKEVLPAVLPKRLIDKNARHLRIYQKQTHLLVYQSVMTNAKKLAVDRNLGLVLLHYPVPHPAGIYDRRRDEISIEPSGNYLDNLRLADRTLGELRRAMEQAGLWDQTIVLVTSDHRWRPEIWKKTVNWTPEEAALAGSLPPKPDRRVPYLLKLAGQKHAHPYYQPFNTVVTHDLLLALLRGELASVDNVVEWLDQHRAHQRESIKDD